MSNTFAQELQRAMLQNPTLPVIPMIHTNVVAGDDNAYWQGRFGAVSVIEYFEADGKAYFLDDDNVEDAVAAAYGKEYAEAQPEPKLVRLYAGLPWQKAVIVFVNEP